MSVTQTVEEDGFSPSSLGLPDDNLSEELSKLAYVLRVGQGQASVLYTRQLVVIWQ